MNSLLHDSNFVLRKLHFTIIKKSTFLQIHSLYYNVITVNIDLISGESCTRLIYTFDFPKADQANLYVWRPLSVFSKFFAEFVSPKYYSVKVLFHENLSPNWIYFSFDMVIIIPLFMYNSKPFLSGINSKITGSIYVQFLFYK